MIAAVLLRGIAVTAVVVLGALLAERALAMLGRPTRFVWLGALLVATVFAGLGVLRHSDSTVPQSRVALAAEQPARVAAAGAPEPTLVERWGRPAAEVSRGRWSALTVPPWLSALDRPLAALWIACSLLWGAILTASAVRLQRQRARWQPEILDGVPVYVSHDVGPALFGIARFGIVVPAWVVDLPATQRRLVVVHEREHARAGDPVTLLAGALLVLLQPLNPFAWLCFQRLRLAIEIDCDARVLARATDVRSYGELLLDVSERTLAGAAPVAALSEGGTHLERRISAMSRPTAAPRALRTTAAATAALLLTAAAWRVPRLAYAQSSEASRSPESAVAAQNAGARVIVRVDELGLIDASEPATVLVWGVGGPIRVAIGTGEMRVLTDTLRLQNLPAMRLDVTDGHAVVRLLDRGRMRLGASVDGGPATRMSATSSQITFLRGGAGVLNGREIPRDLGPEEKELVTAPDSLVRREVAARFPGIFEAAVDEEPVVWVHADARERVIAARKGRGGVRLTYEGARVMLPGLESSLQPQEYMKVYPLPAAGGRRVLVLWVHKKR